MAPEYLLELIKVQRPARDLRSADQMLLDIPRPLLKTRADRAFSVHCGTPCLCLCALRQASLFLNHALRPAGFLWLLAEFSRLLDIFICSFNVTVFACLICCLLLISFCEALWSAIGFEMCSVNKTYIDIDIDMKPRMLRCSHDSPLQTGLEDQFPVFWHCISASPSRT